MTRRTTYVGDDEAALLGAVAREGTLVGAARAAGMSRDRAVYRLRRLARALGGPLVVADRGGRGHGVSRLTPLGLSTLRGGHNALGLGGRRRSRDRSGANVLVGRYGSAPVPHVALGRGGPTLRVAFSAGEGERVGVALDPEAIVLARRPFPSSARNVLEAFVLGRPLASGPGEATVLLRCAGRRLRVRVTPETVAELGLEPRARTYLLVKATALRPIVPPRAARRSR